MGIIYDEKQRIFYLSSKGMSYIIGFQGKNLVHGYWGKRLDKITSIESCVPYTRRGWMIYDPDDRVSSEALSMEYSTYGNTDLREPAFHAQYSDGSTITELLYKSHSIYKGKKKLQGLPAVFASCDEAETLEIVLSDSKTGLEIVLSYTVFNDKDVITRSVKAQNKGTETINIQRIFSASVDFIGRDFDIISLHGAWARERHVQRTSTPYGTTLIDSKRGASGHSLNPFVALAEKSTTENSGEVYAMNFVYSGNFECGAQRDTYNSTRMFMGINHFDFNWRLESEECFTAPEVVMVYSDAGIGGMSRTYHDLYRNNLCGSQWSKKERPVLINNWEATYFDFDEQKIIDIAKKAKEIGVELMVLDDGWFGKRNDDTTSLGDWFVNSEKLPGGIDGLSEKIEELGMKFGLWFEPEMVSPISELNKKHPDWCLQVQGRKKSLGRNQMILDYSNAQVCNYIIDVISNILDTSKISYIKWDMNRNMSEIGSLHLPESRQRETAHRYILGLYYVMETLTNKYPHVLFEGCAGGGGRFDPGILYYMPQIWTSDDSDAVERLYIQYGTSYVYPAVTMGAHVSAVPNHQVGRNTSMKMRADVALMGQFGFELDLNKLSTEELDAAKSAITKYKQLRHTIHNGEMYRLSSPFESNYAIWQFISPDENEIVIGCYNILAKPNSVCAYIKAKNLFADSIYVDEENGISLTGGELMNIGIPVWDDGDFNSRVFVFRKRRA